MPLTKEALRALVSLQEKDKNLDEIRRAIDAVPPRIDAVKADLATEKQRMDAVKALVVELEKKKKGKELDVAAKEEAARKHSAQLNEVKSNDAYRALQEEINKEKAEAGELETAVLMAMEEIDKAKAQEKALAVELKKVEDFAKKDLEKLEAELSHAKGRYDSAKADRDQSAAPVPPAMLRVYEHVRSRGKLDAIVPVIDGHCQACQINLAPSMLMELAKLKELMICESCQRILYKPEHVAAAAA